MAKRPRSQRHAYLVDLVALERLLEDLVVVEVLIVVFGGKVDLGHGYIA